MSEAESINQDKLHAYVDGQLDQTQQSRVEAWLAGHPDEAASIHAYRIQNTRLHETYDTVLDEIIPPELEAIVTGRAKERPAHGNTVPRSWVSPWVSPWVSQGMKLAASIVLLVVGGVGGWLLHDAQGPSAARLAASFADQAMGAHRVFVAEVKHPVEVPANQEAHLVAWLSKRLGTTLRAPDLTPVGFNLIGGRLLAEGAQPAAQFMYEESGGRRVTIYVRASDGASDTSFRFVSDQGVSAFYWVDQAFAYALVAPMERNQLMAIAQRAYSDLIQR